MNNYQIYKTENWGTACKWAVSLNGKVLEIFKTKKEAQQYINNNGVHNAVYCKRSNQ